jgi:hypothetical protein
MHIVNILQCTAQHTQLSVSVYCRQGGDIITVAINVFVVAPFVFFSMVGTYTAGGVLCVACVDAVAGIPDVAVVPAATAVDVAYLPAVTDLPAGGVSVISIYCSGTLVVSGFPTVAGNLTVVCLSIDAGRGGGSLFGQGDRHCGTYSRNICTL